jgi:hypothetical protein
MRFRTAVAVVTLAAAALPARADLKAAQAAYAQLLTTYVSARGVRYATWRTSGDDLKRISEVVMIYRSTDTKTLEPNERKALLINLYNAKILETVLLMNPSGTVRFLSKGLNPNEIFHRNALLLDGRPVSLDDIEKKLTTEFEDPRIHFALNCGSRSCPPIRGEPYAAVRIDDQLDDASRAYLASPGAVEIKTAHHDTTIRTTVLFDWYKDDFKHFGGTIAFLKAYGTPEIAEAASRKNVKIEYQPYDWSLNVAP